MDLGPIDEEICRRLRAQRMRGDFAVIHAAPSGAADVPDQAGARLVLLGPQHPHRAGKASSPGLERAAALLDDAGAGRRAYRNMLVFLAADAARLTDLRALLAGGDAASDRDVAAAVAATWEWLLAPSAARWSVTRAGGQDDLAMRASRVLRAEGSLHVDYPGVRLRADLDRVALWPSGAEHVRLAEVWEAYARSLELPRLRSSAVLAAAVVGGVAAPAWERETFAYAAAYDAERGRYEGLVAGPGASLVLQGSGLIVRPQAARAQLDAEPAAP